MGVHDLDSDGALQTFVHGLIHRGRAFGVCPRRPISDYSMTCPSGACEASLMVCLWFPSENLDKRVSYSVYKQVFADFAAGVVAAASRRQSLGTNRAQAQSATPCGRLASNASMMLFEAFRRLRIRYERSMAPVDAKQ